MNGTCFRVDSLADFGPTVSDTDGSVMVIDDHHNVVMEGMVCDRVQHWH